MGRRFCRGDGCGAPISRQSKKGWCRRCACQNLSRDPEIAARRRAGTARYYSQPEVREERARRMAEFNRNSSPERRELLRAHGRRMFEQHLSKPENAAVANSPETRARAGAAQSNTKLAWCPPERRDEYRKLCASQRLSAAEARRMIEATLPGTIEHARRVIANTEFSQRLREERRRREQY